MSISSIIRSCYNSRETPVYENSVQDEVAELQKFNKSVESREVRLLDCISGTRKSEINIDGRYLYGLDRYGVAGDRELFEVHSDSNDIALIYYDIVMTTKELDKFDIPKKSTNDINTISRLVARIDQCFDDLLYRAKYLKKIHKVEDTAFYINELHLTLRTWIKKDGLKLCAKLLNNKRYAEAKLLILDEADSYTLSNIKEVSTVT